MDIINQIWPNWHTEKFIGEGSYGKVFKVVREDMGHRSYCAVKVISIPHDKAEIQELSGSGMDEMSMSSYYDDMAKAFMNEIKIMESLKTTSNIVAIEDYQLVQKEDGIGWDVYIRMELLTSLNEYQQNHAMGIREVLNLGMDMCDALKNCERVKIIHRDIKVDNIFVNAFGKFKLGDFGIARQLEKTQSVLSKKGTSMYMAPEVYKGEQYDHTVDIYSLGIVMYRFLNNGRYPFMPSAGEKISYGDREEALVRRMSGEVFPPAENADKELTEILNRACAYHPADRYQLAEDMYRALKTYADGLKEEITEPKEEVTSEVRETIETKERDFEKGVYENTIYQFSEDREKHSEQQPEEYINENQDGKYENDVVEECEKGEQNDNSVTEEWNDFDEDYITPRDISKGLAEVLLVLLGLIFVYLICR